MAKAHFKSFLVILFASFALFVLVWVYRDPILENGIEIFANHTQKIFFNQTLDFERIRSDRSLKLHIDKIQGVWQGPEESFPVEVHDIVLKDSLLNFILHKPVHLAFSNFRPKGSDHPGISGEVVVLGDRDGTMEVKANFLGLYLEEIAHIDPENFRGASGKMTGDFYLKTNTRGDSAFSINLTVAEPGGTLQSHFFDILQPYLPAAQKKILQAIREQKNLVGYKEANLKA